MRQKVALIRTAGVRPVAAAAGRTVLSRSTTRRACAWRTRSSDRIIRREHKTAILVTHDIAEAISMSDRVLVFSDRPRAPQGGAPRGPDGGGRAAAAPQRAGICQSVRHHLEGAGAPWRLKPSSHAARQAYLRGVRRRGRFVTFMRYAILAGVIALWELAAQSGLD